MDSGEDGDGMSEPKITYTTIDENGLHEIGKPDPFIRTDDLYKDGTVKWVGDNVPSDFIAKWNPQPIGYITMNGEPLSTEQLHELIVSQSMTIDAALTRNGELVDALKRVRKLLQEGKFYEAWHEINKVLGIV